MGTSDNTVAKIGNAFTSLSNSITGWTITDNDNGVVTFSKNADYVGGATGGSSGDTAQTAISTNSVTVTTGGGTGTGPTQSVTSFTVAESSVLAAAIPSQTSFTVAESSALAAASQSQTSFTVAESSVLAAASPSQTSFTVNENTVISNGSTEILYLGGGATITLTGDGTKDLATLLTEASAGMTGYDITASGDDITITSIATGAANTGFAHNLIAYTGDATISSTANTAGADAETQALTLDGSTSITLTGDGSKTLATLLTEASAGLAGYDITASGNDITITSTATGAANTGFATGGISLTTSGGTGDATISSEDNTPGVNNGNWTAAAVDIPAGGPESSVNAGTYSKIINEHTGFEVTVASALNTQGALSISSVVKAVDVFVDDTDVLSASAAMQAVRVVDDAVAMIGRERAGLGAFQNRLEHAMSNMANNSQNTQAARSVIADADYAKEAAELAKNQILQQAGTAMLAQANSQAETVLNLLK